MTRPIWKGHISFGLINIPVTLYSAENRTDLTFHMVDSRNKARVRYERINEETGDEVPWDKVVKAYEYEDDKLLLMDESDFRHADVAAVQTVAIENFIDSSEMDCAYFDKPYFLVPEKKAEKGYVLLRETLKRAKKIGIAKVVIRTRQYIAALMPRGDALLLNLLRYHQEFKDPSEFNLPKGSLEKYHIVRKELEMAEKFVDSLSSDWDPEKYKDEYRDSLMKWIRSRIKAGGKPIHVEEKEEEAEEPPTDIMALLKKSMSLKHHDGAASGLDHHKKRLMHSRN